MVGLDSGCVSILNVGSEPGSAIDLLASAVEHDNVVSSLSVSRDGTRALTGSLDRRLTLFIFVADSFMSTTLTSILSI